MLLFIRQSSIDDDFLSQAVVADASIRAETSFSSVLFMTERFPLFIT